MPGDMVRDRALLALLFLVGGSSTLWGLYQIYYVSPTSPSGLFNTVLGLLVLLVTWAYLVPYVAPRTSAERPATSRNPPRTPAPRAARAMSVGRPLPAPIARPVAPRFRTASPGRPTPAARSPALMTPLDRSSATARSPAPAQRLPAPRPISVVPPVQMEEEIAEILADLPEPLDPALAAESPDDVVRRLDTLLRDLSAEPARVSGG